MALARTTGTICIMSELQVDLFLLVFACVALSDGVCSLNYALSVSCLQRLEYRRFSVMNNFVMKKLLEYCRQ